jgi:protein TonB
MDSRLLLSLFASVLAHGAMVGWPAQTAPLEPPRIGGAAQALRVAIAPPVSDSSPQRRADRTIDPAPQPRSFPEPLPATAQETSTTTSTERSPEHMQAPETGTARAPKTPLEAAQRKSDPRPIAPASAASAPDAGERISAALQQELAKRFEYPWLARKRGWQGSVTLSLRVDENGELSDWAVSRTSGYAVLDRSALDCARRITRLPEAARWLDGQSLHLMIPVRYRLLDS